MAPNWTPPSFGGGALEVAPGSSGGLALALPKKGKGEAEGDAADAALDVLLLDVVSPAAVAALLPRASTADSRQVPRSTLVLPQQLTQAVLPALSLSSALAARHAVPQRGAMLTNPTPC